MRLCLTCVIFVAVFYPRPVPSPGCLCSAIVRGRELMSQPCKVCRGITSVRLVRARPPPPLSGSLVPIRLRPPRPWTNERRASFSGSRLDISTTAQFAREDEGILSLLQHCHLDTRKGDHSRETQAKHNCSNTRETGQPSGLEDGSTPAPRFEPTRVGLRHSIYLACLLPSCVYRHVCRMRKASFSHCQLLHNDVEIVGDLTWGRSCQQT